MFRSKTKMLNKRPLFRESNLENDENVENPKRIKKPYIMLQSDFKNMHMIESNQDNIYYVFFTNTTIPYCLNRNNCVKLCLINFSNKFLLQVDGYQLRQGESATVSTFFDHQCSIRFVPNRNSNPSTPVNLRLFVETNFDDSIEPESFIHEYDHKLKNGEIMMVQVEIAQEALQRTTRSMLYLDYGITDLKADELLRSKLDSDWNNEDGLEKSFFKETIERQSDVYDVLEKLANDLNVKEIDKVFVIGAKNSGKSSALHYLMNRQISTSKNSSVFYLEGDPGQTEFAPQGVLTLAKIDSYKSTLSGSEFMLKQHDGLLTNEKKAIFSQILGTNNVEDLSMEYIQIIRDLYNRFHQLKQNSTLFINTMGWIQDEGYNLLMKMIEIIRPTKIILIDPQNHLPTSEKAMQKVCQQIKSKLFTCNTCSLPDFKSSPYKKSRTQRQITQISYFCASLSPEINIRSIRRIEKQLTLSLKEVIIHHCSRERINPAQIYDLLHYTWIYFGALPIEKYQTTKKYILEHETYTDLDMNLDLFDDDESSNDSSHTSDSVDSASNPVRSTYLSKHLPLGASCLGGGFVTAVNPQKDEISLLGPIALTLNQQLIKSINLIVIPINISIPKGFLLEEDPEQEIVPYTLGLSY